MFRFPFTKVLTASGEMIFEALINLRLRFVDGAGVSPVQAEQPTTRFRIDTGADYTTMPIWLGPAFGMLPDEIKRRAVKRVPFHTALHQSDPNKPDGLAYLMPMEISLADGHGGYATWVAPIAFVEGEVSLLAGHVGFLNVFDFRMYRAKGFFELNPIDQKQLNYHCPSGKRSGRIRSLIGTLRRGFQRITARRRKPRQPGRLG